MRSIDRVLELVRDHPEGITTTEIMRVIYPYAPLTDTTYNTRARAKCASLARYGLIEGTVEYRPNINGIMGRATVWRPLP